MHKEHALTLLWDSFINRLENNWEPYAQFGENVAEASSHINFSAAVIDQIDLFFNKEGVNFETPNKHTLHNYFKTNGFSVNAKRKTLNTFSAFLGHDNWNTFLEHSKTLSKKQQQDITSDAQTNLSNQQNKTVSNSIVYALGAVALIGIIAFLFTRLGCNGNHSEQNIISAITLGNEAEFNAYVHIPKIDSNILKKYFTTDGTAYNSILGLVLRSKAKKRSLLVPPSSYVIENIEIEKIEENSAIAYTTEHWMVRWYDSLEQKEILYDTVNNHKYYLKLDSNKWKVHIDEYVGRARIPASEIIK